MRAGGGKQKGSAFEREVCKRLSLWVTYGKKEDCFWRSALSGGRATVAMKRGDLVRQAGDLCAVAPEGFDFADRYYVECKFYRKLDIEAFILMGKGKLADFWRVAAREADRYHKIPLLIARQNRTPPFVITSVKRYFEPFASAYILGCHFVWFDSFLKIDPEDLQD